MSLEQIVEKIKGVRYFYQFYNILLSLFVVLIVFMIYGISAQLWYLKVNFKPMSGVNLIDKAFEMVIIDQEKVKNEAKFVASVSGKKYYPVGCKSANRIKEANKVYFKSQEEAESAGYTPTVTCSK